MIFITLRRIKKKYKAVMKMVFATGNSGKLREASEILGKGFELVTPAQTSGSIAIPTVSQTIPDLK